MTDTIKPTARIGASRLLDAANMLAFLLPMFLLAGAVSFQKFGGLVPCEMCMMQRWPHVAAAAIATMAFLIRNPKARRMAVMSAAFAILTSAAIAVDHLGVERHWWAGHTACTSAMPTGLSTAEFLEKMMSMPLVRCDVPQWTFIGLSLADLNAMASGIGGLLTGLLVLRSRKDLTGVAADAA